MPYHKNCGILTVLNLTRLMLSCQTVRSLSDIDACNTLEWQENDPEPWKHLHCTLQATMDYATSFSDQTQQNYGFETKNITEIEAIRESFICASDSSTTSANAEDFISLDVDMCLAQMPGMDTSNIYDSMYWLVLPY